MSERLTAEQLARLRGEWFRPEPELLEWIERFATRTPDAAPKALDFEE